jgi:heme/copper-type cytochrome/quinol oxidase subunit 3
LTHQSKWATLTFEISHKHDSSTHTHNDEHHHEEEGIPMWIFIVGSLVVIGLLFVVFRKKS